MGLSLKIEDVHNYPRSLLENLLFTLEQKAEIRGKNKKKAMLDELM